MDLVAGLLVFVDVVWGGLNLPRQIVRPLLASWPGTGVVVLGCWGICCLHTRSLVKLDFMGWC